MKSGTWLLFLAATASAAPLHVRPEPAAWTAWAPRPEIMPRTFVDRVHARSAAGSLAISGNSNPAAWGGWVHTVSGVESGAWYRFSAWYRTEGVAYERGQVLSRLNWVRAEGKRAGQPEYVYATEQQGEWTRITLDAPAPADATGAQIQLFLANAPASTVWWDEITLDQIPPPAPRKVIVESINYRPRAQASSSEVVGQFLDQVDRLTTKADIILLPEGITVVNTGKKYADVAEPRVQQA